MHNLNHLKREVLVIPSHLSTSSLKAVKPEIESLALIPIERTLMSPRRPRGGVNRPVKIQLETLLEQRAALPLFKNKADSVKISQIVTWPSQLLNPATERQNPVRRLDTTKISHERGSSYQTLTTASKELNQQEHKVTHARHKIYPVVQLATKACLSPCCWGIHKRIGSPPRLALPSFSNQENELLKWGVIS